ncbi:MAG: hypothetical protein IJG52_04055 [Lachnospiraceae bacterium]|nr:hypothetical protein [Lachnospiraceae bacterium]
MSEHCSDSCFSPLGQGASTPILSALKIFPEDFKTAAELAGDKPLKLVNITNVKEAGAEGKETGNADYYKELLGAAGWNLASDPEEVAIIVDGKPYKCAVAHNLGQVRKQLEGDCKNYAVVRLMA